MTMVQDISVKTDELGLMVRPVENLNVMSPPLIITKEDVDFIVSTLRQSINSAIAELKAKGVMKES